ncbi:DUF3419 family protein [Pontibacter sp. G13]|uniref:DUF3419 family protein n=1 Tax=Pontibacter sp. G13 TaxID=3074898 RepID=UPI00288BEDB3|nr:DUF3419 family protein [Pontibacter sp. G13]WNJ17833.1 DUF3419 family protein [Pontibacter sp. G13]
MSKLTDQVDFSLIRYASCWEDAERLVQGLEIEPHHRVLSVASAGDNSLSLLTAGPRLVKAVDVSMPQLYLTELKRAAFAWLSYEEMMALLGFEESEKRWSIYQYLRPRLHANTRTYWDDHRTLIEKGLIYQGKLEQYFKLFSTRVLPWIHGPRTVNALFDQKTETQQAEFFRKVWNTWRWRTCFRIFFSKWVMGKIGRDPAFLEQVEVPVSTFILNQAARHLADPYCVENPFLRMIMTGSFDEFLPHYVKRIHFDQIKAQIYSLEIESGYVQDHAAEEAFDRFNLSNIFEYVDGDTFRAISDKLLRHATPRSRFAYWNLMVPRSLQTLFPAEVQLIQTPFHRPDDGFFYRSFEVVERLALPQTDRISTSHTQNLSP